MIYPVRNNAPLEFLTGFTVFIIGTILQTEEKAYMKISQTAQKIKLNQVIVSNLFVFDSIILY
jgi:hypothetical protein